MVKVSTFQSCMGGGHRCMTCLYFMQGVLQPKYLSQAIRHYHCTSSTTFTNAHFHHPHRHLFHPIGVKERDIIGLSSTAPHCIYIGGENSPCLTTAVTPQHSISQQLFNANWQCRYTVDQHNLCFKFLRKHAISLYTHFFEYILSDFHNINNEMNQHQPTVIYVYSRHKPEQLPKRNKNENTDWLMHDITGIKWPLQNTCTTGLAAGVAHDTHGQHKGD